MIRKGFKVLSLPVSWHASANPVSACQPVQEYNTLGGEWYPDRTLVPLVIQPLVGYSNPNNGHTESPSASRLTNGHWYRVDNTTGPNLSASNEIKPGTLYTIDTTSGSATYGKLTSRENILPGNPVTYVFTATLVPDVGDPVAIRASWQARTKATERYPVFSLSNSGETMYNPWEDADLFTISPDLKPMIAGATFTWESQHGGVWKALGSTHYDWAVSKSGNAITVRRTLMQDRLDLRCTVRYTSGGKIHTETINVTIARRLPAYTCDIIGVSNLLAGDKSIAPRALIETAKGILTDPKGELTVRWYNSANSLVGEGMQPVISISALGSTMEVGLEVKDTGGWKALELSNGHYLTDGEGRIIIVR